MPSPYSKNADRGPILASRYVWKDRTDHELCEEFVETHRWDRSLKERIVKRGRSTARENDDLQAAERALAALYEEIASRMKKIIRRTEGLDASQVDDIVQELMRKLIDPCEATSNSLRGRFPGATGSFARTVRDRTKDNLKAERREVRRRSTTATTIPPLAANEEPIDLDRLRSYITDTNALAVFDGLRAGFTHKEIAVRLEVSERTVTRYRAHALGEIRRKRAEEDR